MKRQILAIGQNARLFHKSCAAQGIARWSVTPATSREEALVHIAERRFDVAVLGASIVRSARIELAAAIKRLQPAIKVVMLHSTYEAGLFSHPGAMADEYLESVCEM